MRFAFEQKNWRGLRGTTCGKPGPVRHIIKNGVPVDSVTDITPEVLRATLLRKRAPRGERSVAEGLRSLGFEHSVPFHGYVLDFFNEYLKICIEIDGPHHAKPDRRKSDQCRDAALRGYGVRTWRFKEYWARGNPASLVAYVQKLLNRMVPDEQIGAAK